MQRSSDWAWASVVLLAGLSLVHCGARTTLNDDAETPVLDAGGADGVAGGACEPDPTPCAGSTGELEPYARLRTSPCGSVTVNRKGTPVAICHHIK